MTNPTTPTGLITGVSGETIPTSALKARAYDAVWDYLRAQNPAGFDSIEVAESSRDAEDYTAEALDEDRGDATLKALVEDFGDEARDHIEAVFQGFIDECVKEARELEIRDITVADTPEDGETFGGAWWGAYLYRDMQTGDYSWWESQTRPGGSWPLVRPAGENTGYKVLDAGKFAARLNDLAQDLERARDEQEAGNVYGEYMEEKALEDFLQNAMNAGAIEDIWEEEEPEDEDEDEDAA